MAVKAWCFENGINIKSYYYRLRKLREELCNSAQQAVQICSFSAYHSVVIRRCNYRRCRKICFTMLAEFAGHLTVYLVTVIQICENLFMVLPQSYKVFTIRPFVVGRKQ